MPVHYEVAHGIAVLTIEHPPVNCLDLPTRRALLDALRRAIDDPQVQAIVLTGGAKVFSAGADIAEFAEGAQGNALAEPILPHVADAIELAFKPVVAAISGVCLGGGLELALACHERVAAGTARFALPEIKLGIIPGAGGTQRLPRIIGVEHALEMMLSGAPVGAASAANIGLVRLSLGNSVLADAKRVALEAAGGAVIVRTRDRKLDPVAATAALEAASGRLRAKRDSPAARGCIEAVKAALEKSFDEAGRLEFRLFTDLLQTSQAQALQHVFFSERAASRVADLPKGTVPRVIESVAIIGSGTMGTGIAMCAANAGLQVKLIDERIDALDRSIDSIRRTYDASIRKGKLDPAEGAARLGRITTAVQLTDARGADLFIEAVFEDLAVKEKVFVALDSIAKRGAVLASNTSTLDLNRIAAFTRRPWDVIGLHFFSPANIMRLLEVVRGSQTSPEVVATAMLFAKQIGKVGVQAGVCDGFIGNRMFEEYLRQAYFLLDEGAMPWQVDGALEGWGMAMGPLAVMDLAGNDIGWAIRKRRAVQQPGRVYSGIPDRICELGRFGRKTGAGFYKYEAGGRERLNDPAIEQLIVDYSREVGVVRRAITDEEIVSRCVLALFNEGTRLLGEGIARRASDIDVVYTSGYGFPADRGGPMFYGDTLGSTRVLAAMAEFRAGYHGEFWEPAPGLGGNS